MKKINFIDVGIDDSKFVMENEEVIEFEISENISLMYSKDNKKYYIYGIDYSEAFDDFYVDIEEDSFNGMEIDGVMITKKDFNDFKELINKVS